MTTNLELRQHLTVVQNRWDLLRLEPGGGETVLGQATQKRFSLKEQVRFVGTDGSLVFSIGARNVLEVAGTYDVLDADGVTLATIKKEFARSLTRSTYAATTPAGAIEVAERGTARAIIRRIWMLTDLPWFLPIHFDISLDGTVVGFIDRRRKLVDRYLISYDGDIDWRVAAALGVAADAFMNR